MTPVVATGTGKMVMAAFDYTRFRREHPTALRPLFAVHRMEILHQARDCFRAVLRDFNVGELLVDGQVPAINRLQAVLQAINRYQPNSGTTRAIGFCASVKHG